MHEHRLRDLEPSSRPTSVRYRYWSHQSQPFAVGDQLLRYLEAGWDVEDRVEVETHWFGEARHIIIFHFTLVKGQNRLVMPVLGGPFARELVRSSDDFELVPVRERRHLVRFSKVDSDRLSSEVRTN